MWQTKVGSSPQKKPHWNHIRPLESVLLEKCKRTCAGSIRQQRDAQKAFLSDILGRVPQQFTSHPLPSKVPGDNQILENNDEPSFGGADRKQEVDHPDYLICAAEHEDPTPAGLLQDETQPAHLVVEIRPEVALLRKEIHEQFRKRWKILDGSRFNPRQFMHATPHHGKRLRFLKVNFLKLKMKTARPSRLSAAICQEPPGRPNRRSGKKTQ
jgi:hypothetical protein